MKQIILIGDSAVDHTVYVKTTRLCPEAPVPVVIPLNEIRTAGMAGNVLENLYSLTNRKEPIVIFRPAHDCVKTRYVDESTGYIMLRVDRDAIVEPFNPAALVPVLSKSVGAIVVSDYAKGFLNKKNIRGITKLAGKFDIPVFLDTKLTLGAWSKDVAYVKINHKEWEHNLKTGCPHPEQCCKYLIVTSASEGTFMMTRSGRTFFPVEKVNVADVCGAGDTFLAALALKYVKTNDICGAIEFANAVSSFSVTKHGIYCVTQQDLYSLNLVL